MITWLKLGVAEMEKGRAELVVKHRMLAAAQWDYVSLNAITMIFLEGHATKSQFDKGLSGNQEAKDKATSGEREQCAKWNAAADDCHIFTWEELAEHDLKKHI